MKFKYAALTVMISSLIVPCCAEETAVPADLQAAIFKKIFAYDKSLPENSVSIAVAFNDSVAGAKDQIVKAFRDSGLSASAVKADSLMSSIKGVHVIYFFPGIAGVKQVCQKNGILCISGASDLVESGEASIGLTLVEKKPKILIHLKELKAEGHELSSNVMQLARVIQ